MMKMIGQWTKTIEKPLSLVSLGGGLLRNHAVREEYH
jgi:hypothetical protein